MSYLLVDAANDSILAEYESLEDLVPIVEQIRKEQPQREVLVARFDEHQGELASTQSIVTARALSDREGFAIFGR